ncbi:ArsR family transcriptional regulator [Nocardioides iriomotensis]|uniref:ArsR family transcriptional regulator n=2 Tax=Nocardioides iriomotensis TaxID=715784 RepID=A0A4Q5J840_9ACTN|nr:ArsR family transcriptional regulator [Nocardioides iriomotensis]
MTVEQRARVHAALADPHRLRIVDALFASDLSPAELGDRLGLASNLLAHHLRTLETAGVLTRHRSSGDRRRTYLTLAASALTDLTPVDSGLDRGAVTRVVFVCTANTARSQLAASLWTLASPVPATSAGTHPADRIAPGALDVARRHGMPLEQARPRSLDQLDQPVTDTDYLVTVCDHAHEELALDRTRPADAHWSVPDPVAADTPAAFDVAYDDLAGRVAHLSPRLIPGLEPAS